MSMSRRHDSQAWAAAVTHSLPPDAAKPAPGGATAATSLPSAWRTPAIRRPQGDTPVNLQAAFLRGETSHKFNDDKDGYFK